MTKDQREIVQLYAKKNKVTTAIAKKELADFVMNCLKEDKNLDKFNQLVDELKKP